MHRNATLYSQIFIYKTIIICPLKIKLNLKETKQPEFLLKKIFNKNPAGSTILN